MTEPSSNLPLTEMKDPPVVTGCALGDRPSKINRSLNAKEVTAQSTDDDVQASPVVNQPPQGTTSKPRRPNQPLSCGECRRLKLKCDRKFPCQTCVKRGCEGICPDGALTSGKGSRYVLANTEQLHEKIVRMSDRIRALEEALESIQSKYAPSDGPHPLLKRELLLIKASLELYGLKLPLPDEDQPHVEVGQSQAHIPLQPKQPSVVSEGRPFVSITHVEQCSPAASPRMDDHHAAGELLRDPNIVILGSAAPISWLAQTATLTSANLRQRLRDALPTRNVAKDLCAKARKYSYWQYVISPSDKFEEKLIQVVYSAALDEMPIRRMSLLFAIMAIGSCADAELRPEMKVAECYHMLSLIALCDGAVIDDPDLTLVQCLFLIVFRLMTFSTCKKGANDAWAIMGVAAKVVQSLGLHRDAGQIKDKINDFEERQMVFRELLNLDTILSLTLNRPPSFSFAHTDRNRPSYHFCSYNDAQFNEWKHDFLQECLAPVLEIMVSIISPDYADVLKADRKIRDFPLPKIYDEQERPAQTLEMQQGYCLMRKEIVLLQLHRSFYSYVLGREGGAPMTHRFAPSILATFRSACKILENLDQLYMKVPALLTRYTVFWFHAFSGIVALCLLVSRSPSSSLAPRALKILDRANNIFSTAATACLKAEQLLPTITSLVSLSKLAYRRWLLGTLALSQHDTDKPDMLTHIVNETWNHEDDEGTNSSDGILAGEGDTVNYWRYVHASLLDFYREVRAGEDGSTPEQPMGPSSFANTACTSGVVSGSQSGASSTAGGEHNSAHLSTTGLPQQAQCQGPRWSPELHATPTQSHDPTLSTRLNFDACAGTSWNNPEDMIENIQVQRQQNLQTQLQFAPQLEAPPTSTLAHPLRMCSRPQRLPLFSSGLAGSACDGTASTWLGSFLAFENNPAQQVLQNPQNEPQRDLERTNTPTHTASSSGTQNSMDSASFMSHDDFFGGDPHPPCLELQPLPVQQPLLQQAQHQQGRSTQITQPLNDEECQLQEYQLQERYTNIRALAVTDPLMFNEYSASTPWMDWL